MTLAAIYSSETAPEVRDFVETEIWAISPYSQPEFTWTPFDLFQEARRRYGDCRCLGLKIPVH